MKRKQISENEKSSALKVSKSGHYGAIYLKKKKKRHDRHIMVAGMV